MKRKLTMRIQDIDRQCRFCGKLCKNAHGLARHEATCPENPRNEKLVNQKLKRPNVDDPSFVRSQTEREPEVATVTEDVYLIAILAYELGYKAHEQGKSLLETIRGLKQFNILKVF
jgi:hypothetical protein